MNKLGETGELCGSKQFIYLDEVRPVSPSKLIDIERSVAKEPIQMRSEFL